MVTLSVILLWVYVFNEVFIYMVIFEWFSGFTHRQSIYSNYVGRYKDHENPYYNSINNCNWDENEKTITNIIPAYFIKVT